MRRKHLFISVPLLAAALFVTSSSLPFGAVMAQTGAYNAATINESTDVFSGPSNTFYVVGQVPKGSTVVVQEMLAGWFKIAPPQGTLSVVAKSAVALSDDKKSGLVQVDKAEVFALNPKGISESNKKQGTLDKGAKVQIQGEDGAFYKITPPATASVFLKPGAVRRLDLINEKEPVAVAPAPAAAAPVTATPATPAHPAPAAKVEKTPKVVHATTQPLPPEAQPLDASKAAPKPAAPPANPQLNKAQADISAAKGDPSGTPYVAPTPAPKATEPAPAPKKPAAKAPKAAEPAAAPAAAPAPAPAPAGPAAQTNPDSPALNTLELKLEEIQQLPLEQQPLADLLKQYQTMSEDTSLSRRDGQIIKARLQKLPQSMDIAKTLKDMAVQKLEIPAPEKKAAPVTETVTTTQPSTENKAATELINKDPVKYDAVGTLLASAVYDGTDAPRLYRLTDTANSRTIVYVQPGDNYEPRQVLGQVVGIVGQTTYNPGLGLRIITVDRIDIMQSVPATGTNK
jgi:uncharacterized protein YgiM (DUF1202 family)